MARPARETYGATVGAYALGFLPLPLLSVAWLMHIASDPVLTGSTMVFWVLLAAAPGALVLGPLWTRRTLLQVEDPYALRTAKASIGFGVLGIVLMMLPFGLLLVFGWVGMIADLALVSVTVPALARQWVLGHVENERLAEKARRKAERARARR